MPAIPSDLPPITPRRSTLEVAKKCLSLWESFIESCGEIALPIS